MGPGLSGDEEQLLVYGLDEPHVPLVEVLILLGLRAQPHSNPNPPPRTEVESAFAVLAGLSAAGLVAVGDLEYVDSGPPGPFSERRHVEQPIDDVRERVLAACRERDRWEWSCVVINTDAGNTIATATAIADRD